MSSPDTRELLDGLLSGELYADANLIRDLVRNRVLEDVNLEYKRGAWLDLARRGNREPARRIRRHVSSFANSQGGTLIVGVAGHEGGSTDSPAWSIAPIRGLSVEHVRAWAEGSLRQIAPQLTSQPRIFVGEHGDDGAFLIVAVRRSDVLVPVVEGGEATYYLRFGDGTGKAPPYLVADLLLGRRERAELDIYLECVEAIPNRAPESPRFGPLARVDFRWCRLTFIIENDSLVWADGLHAGLVVENPMGRMPYPTRRIFEVVEHNGRHFEDLRHLSVNLPPGARDLAPTSSVQSTAVDALLPWCEDLEWHAALYVGARNTPVRWTQIYAWKDVQSGNARVTGRPVVELRQRKR